MTTHGLESCDWGEPMKAPVDGLDVDDMNLSIAVRTLSMVHNTVITIFLYAGSSILFTIILVMTIKPGRQLRLGRQVVLRFHFPNERWRAMIPWSCPSRGTAASLRPNMTSQQGLQLPV